MNFNLRSNIYSHLCTLKFLSYRTTRFCILSSAKSAPAILTSASSWFWLCHHRCIPDPQSSNVIARIKSRHFTLCQEYTEDEEIVPSLEFWRGFTWLPLAFAHKEVSWRSAQQQRWCQNGGNEIVSAAGGRFSIWMRYKSRKSDCTIR